MSLPKTLQSLQAGMAAGLHIGAQLCVLRNGEIVADIAIGESRPGVPMTPDTIMLWFSSSKPLTAVAILQLYEQSKLNLDDPIIRWIPEYAQNDPQKSIATIRQILTHTAGVPYVHLGWPRTSWEEIIARICAGHQPTDWTPGEKAGYSPFTSWFLLGEIIRRVDGRMIHDYLREEIFTPLNLHYSWLAVTPEQYAQLKDNLGIMQNTHSHPPIPLIYDTLEACTHPRPAGSGHGPIRELALFYEALRLGGKGILKPQTIADMTHRHRAGMFDQTFKEIVDWGLGVMINSWQPTVLVPYQYGPHASRNTFGHGGYQSSIGFCDPDNALSIALVYNGCCGETPHNQRANETLTALYEDLGF